MSIRRAAVLCFLFSLAGLLTALYLSALHIALLRGELLGGPFCGGAGSFLNCHAVAASRFSRLLGVPIAFWGVLAYLFLLSLSFVALKFPELRRQALTAAAAFAAACFLLDLGLLGLMLFKIKALCLFCVLMYAFKWLTVLTVKRGLGKKWDNLFKPTLTFMLGLKSPLLPAAAWLVVWVTAVGLGGILAVHATADYFTKAPGSLQERVAVRMKSGERVAVNPAGGARSGSPSAPVQAVMFTDPGCPLCREAAEFNEAALKSHPGKLSIVVLPMRSKEALRLGVSAAPTFFVNGVKIQGAITPAQFDEIIRQEENSLSATTLEVP